MTLQKHEEPAVFVMPEIIVPYFAPLYCAPRGFVKVKSNAMHCISRIPVTEGFSAKSALLASILSQLPDRAGLKRPDPGDLALEELQQEMLIDRGPSSVPKKGIPYLSPEGFPYRIFEKAHAGLVRAGKRIKAADAICSVIETYLRAAVFVTPRRLAFMFKLLFSESEMHEAIAALVQANKTLQTRNYVLYVPMKGD